MGRDGRSTRAELADAERARNRDACARMADDREVVAKVFSAVMDEQTCAACTSWDDAWFNVADDQVEIPLPTCTCEEGCRCMWVFVMRDEDASAVPPLRDFRT